jgi:hypothetical protein
MLPKVNFKKIYKNERFESLVKEGKQFFFYIIKFDIMY